VGPSGTIKRAPEDFFVEEIPAYLPSGVGEHRYLHIRKVDRTTDDVVRELAGALGIDRREIGVAGLKDKVAITTQWLSIPASASIEGVALDGVEILEHALHGNKLRTGHLTGNRFTIVVRDVTDVDAVVARLTVIAKGGVPNAFGAQRFGREGDTHERARAWLTGHARAPKDARQRRFEFSALQSAIFNEVLAARVAGGTWNIPIDGDVLKKEETGGLFVCTDVQLDRERAERGEVSPTGPIVGDKMKEPERDALALEERIVGPRTSGIDLRRARALGEGTRRPLRIRLTELSHRVVASSVDEPSARPQIAAPEAAGGVIEVRFVLPKGAYATTVLENALTLTDASATRTRTRTQTKNEEE
jgi:tRNA pseudouridine13 synthase